MHDLRRLVVLSTLPPLLLLAGCSDPASRKPSKPESVALPSAGRGVTDGTYLVGKDIPAGMYRTLGVLPGSGTQLCIWERAKDDSGSYDSFLDSRSGTGPDRVTLRAGEYFRTDGCKPWTRQ